MRCRVMGPRPAAPSSWPWTVGATSSSWPRSTTRPRPTPTNPPGNTVSFGYSSPDRDVVDYECFVDGVTAADEVPCDGTATGGTVQLALDGGGHQFFVAALDNQTPANTDQPAGQHGEFRLLLPGSRRGGLRVLRRRRDRGR